jgi:iron complex outermembrane receptor protein
MMEIRNGFLAVAAVLLLSEMPSAAFAEESGAIGIEEVVVTARRREETAQSVPIPITAMSAEQMRDRAANDLTDISRITPNMDYQKSASNRGTAQVFLRSIGQVNWAPTQDPKVGVYLDGVYLGRPQGAVFDIMDLERVEVLRGPQGTLFGRNTTAGLVHVITRKPTDEFEAEVMAGAGNDGQLSAGGIINIPISDTLATRFSFQHRESDGYTENRGTGDDWNDEDSQMFRGSARWTPTDSFQALLTADYQRVREHPGLGTCEWSGPDDGADQYADFRASQLAQVFDPSVPLELGLQTAAYVLGVYDEIRDTCNNTSPFSSGENDPDEATLDAWGVALNLEWDFREDMTLTSITSYRDMDDQNDSWGWATDKVGTAPYLEVLGFGENPSDQFSQEFRISGSTENLDWVGGIYYFEEQSVNELDVPLFRGVAPPSEEDWPIYYEPLVGFLPPDVSEAITGFPNVGSFMSLIFQGFGSRIQRLDGENESKAVFAEVTWRFAEDWSVTAGVRYTEDDREFNRSQVLSSKTLDPTLLCPDQNNNNALTIAPMVDSLAGVTGPMRCQVEEEFDEVTPRVIFSYNVNDDVMLYGGWSKGYSSGGFNQDVRSRPFEPEISENWEFGMKSNWADNRLLLNLTGFFNDYENQQITVGRTVDNQPTADLINAQKAELWGIEGEIRWVPAEGWNLMATFGWIDGDYDEFSVLDTSTDAITGEPIITPRDLSDSKVVRGADYTYSLSVSYSHYFDGGGELTSQVGWSERGRTYNTLDTVDSSKQDAFGLMDARITYIFPNRNTSLSLWGRNILDEEYFVSAIDLSGGLSPDDPQYIDGVGVATGTNTKYWGEPSRFGLELRHTFAN